MIPVFGRLWRTADQVQGQAAGAGWGSTKKGEKGGIGSKKALVLFTAALPQPLRKASGFPRTPINL